MAHVRIWDGPTRVIHWLLAAGLVAAFLIAQVGGEHSSVFDYHAILGLVLALVLLLRLGWGVVGTQHARFTSYVFSPTELIRYARSVLSAGGSVRYVGHNPATSWAAPLMFGLLGVIVATGVMMGRGLEAAEELHAASVYALLVVVGGHVLGVVVHSLRHRENLIGGMISGRKLGEPTDAIRSGRPVATAVVVMLVAGFAGALVANYDRAGHHTHLPILGTTIGVGEGEEGNEMSTTDRRHDDD